MQGIVSVQYFAWVQRWEAANVAGFSSWSPQSGTLHATPLRAVDLRRVLWVLEVPRVRFRLLVAKHGCTSFVLSRGRRHGIT